MATREEQRARARREILDATANLVAERRLLNFTLAEVAQRSEKSLRTIYNHFASREELLASLSERFDEMMRDLGGVYVDQVGGLDDVPDAIGVNFAIFEQLGGLTEAFARLAGTDGPDARARRQRTEAFTKFALERFPDLDDHRAAQIGQLIRHAASSRIWYALTREMGQTTETTATLLGWLVDLIISAVEDDNLPPGDPAAGPQPA